MTRLITLSTLLLSSLCMACSDSSQEADLVAVPESGTDSATTTAQPLTYQATALSPDDFFSSRDYRTTIDSENPVTLHCDGSTITADGEGVNISGSVATITQEGSYILTGTLSQGQILVEMADETHKAQLILDNVSLTCDTSAAIQVVTADKVFITTTEGSQNFITSTISPDNSIDGGIYSKSDVTLNGEGSLTLNVTGGAGVVANDELTITSGAYQILADGHGLDANDGIAIAQGDFTITAGKDGLHCEHSSNLSKGNIFILDGNFAMDVQQDGLDAGGFLEIQGGVFDITTCGGWAAAPVKVAAANTMGGGMGAGQGVTRPEMTQDQAGLTGEMGQISQDHAGMTGQMGQIPQDQAGMTGQMGGMGQIPQDQAGMTGQMGEIPQDQAGMTGQMGGMPQDQAGMTGQMGEIPQDQAGMTGQMGGMGQIPQDQAGMTQGQTGVLLEGNYVIDGEEDPDLPSTKGLKAAGDLRLYGGTYVLDCYDDSIHSDTLLAIHDGNYTLSTADDAIHANWDTIITGGTIDILTSFEGIEGQRIDISGGEITMYCGDDGINGASFNPDPEDSTIYINISGGKITMDTNMEGDGLDSNGSIQISGGEILVSSTTDQRDTSLDSQGTSLITGGTFLATGSNSGTIQNFNDGSTQASILVRLTAIQTGRVTLTDSAGTVIADFDPVKEYQAVAISSPELQLGETYTLVMGEQSQTITLDALQYGSGGNTTMGGTTGRR